MIKLFGYGTYSFPDSFPIWLFDISFSKNLVQSFISRFPNLKILLPSKALLEVMPLRSTGITLLLNYYGHLRLLMTPYTISQTAYRNMFRLPASNHKTSHVHIHTICKHTISHNPGSPAWCKLPFLPMQ